MQISGYRPWLGQGVGGDHILTYLQSSLNVAYAINFYIKVIIEFGYWIVDLIQSFDINRPHIFPTASYQTHTQTHYLGSLDPRIGFKAYY